MPQGPRLVTDDGSQVQAHKWVESAAASASQIVTTRFAIWFVAASVPIVVGFAGWGGNRIISTLDQAVERQALASRDIAEIRAQVTGNIALNTASMKTIAERLEESNKVLNDRQNAQANWMQQLATKLEELTKYVYQKVR